MTTTTATRIERDPLGALEVPADALYGVQTLRAMQNFPISGLRPLSAFVEHVLSIRMPSTFAAEATSEKPATRPPRVPAA